MKIKITGDFNVLIELVEAQPKSVTNLEANYMSGNVELAWENPTERTDDTPLPVEEIGEIWIDARQEEIPDWTRVATITDPVKIAEATHLFPSAPGGTWIFRVSGVDTGGQAFDGWEEITIVVPAGPVAPPKPVTNLTATLVPNP
jgi:hypothetical protein